MRWQYQHQQKNPRPYQWRQRRAPATGQNRKRWRSPRKDISKAKRNRDATVQPFPKTPACYGFSVVAKVKSGKEQVIRDYGKSIEQAVKADPSVLAPLKLHYLRWLLFDVGSGLHFMYQGIFDTDFDKYIEDAVELFVKTGITTVFVKSSKGGRRRGRLEDERWSGDRILSRPSVSQLPGIRRVSVCRRRW